VAEAPHHQVAVNLIAYDHDPAPGAELGQPQQGRPAPDAADGVVRAAENEHAGALVDDPLQGFEVHLPEAAVQHQGFSTIRRLLAAMRSAKG